MKRVKKLKSVWGFTLVEIILVLGVTAVMITVGSNNYLSLKNSKSIDGMANLVIADISHTMERSKTQEGGVQWWMHFINPAGAGNDYYQICSGTFTTAGANCAAEGGVEALRRTNRANLTFTDPAEGATKAVVFRKSTGLPTATTSLTFIVSGTSLSKTITINSNGRIDVNGIFTPTVTTVAASSVSPTAATLNGSTNPNGIASTGWFRYSSTNPGSCNDTFGVRAPASGGSSLGAGSSPVAYNQAISGLTTDVTYYFCALSSNSAGTSLGAVLSFTANNPPGPATVTTVAASSVTTTTATLNGSAIPNSFATTGWFRYSTTNPGTCNDTFGTRTPASGGTSLGSGTSTVPYSQPITGLTSSATYYFCAIASNSGGTSYGAVLSFVTGTVPPEVTTTAATSVATTTATLNGTGDPNGATATGWFRYSTTNPGTCNDTFGTRAPVSGGDTLGAGSSAVAYNEPVTGLTQATTYYFCALVQNSAGTVVGSVLSFTTTAAPTVITLPAS